MTFIINKILSEENYGGKASRLLELQSEGFLIPSFFIIPYPVQHKILAENERNKNANADTFQQLQFPGWFTEELKNTTAQLHYPLTVRSSCNVEDGTESSFAGQFESVMNIQCFEDLLSAVKHCWASLFSVRVREYAAARKINFHDIEINLIVQEQIRSELSGVVFTVNHQTGEGREMIVEAIRGQGEALVQGMVTPDIFQYNWFTDKIEKLNHNQQSQYLDYKAKESGLEWYTMSKNESLINPLQIKELCAQCLKIQEYYGLPLDIEWSFFDKKFYILQARPLTSIHFSTKLDWTNADLKDGGISSSVTTPMMYSLYEMVFEHSMPYYFKSIGILGNERYDKWFTEWMGYSYWNLQAVKEGAKKIPGFVERNFDKSFGIEPGYEGKGHTTGFTFRSIINGLRILNLTNKSIKNRENHCSSAIEKAAEFYNKAIDFLAHKPGWSEITAFLKLLKVYYLTIECNYFYTIYDNSNAATFCQEKIDKAKKHNPEIDYLNMVIGLQDLSHLRPAIALWNFSRKILQNMDALNFYTSVSSEELLHYQNQAYPLKKEWQSITDRFAHKSYRELDLLEKRWPEDYAQPLALLKEFLRTPDEQSPQKQVENQHIRFKKSFDKLTKKRDKKSVNTHRHLLWWREEMRDHSTKTYAFIRRILSKIESKMIAENLLQEKDDIFFLKLDELIKYTETKDIQAFQQLIQHNKQYRKSFRNFKKPNEIYRRQNYKLHTDVNLGNVMKGIGGAPGVIQGIARVIKNIYDAESLKTGEILVTPYTDPGWTTYFSRIGGLVTETGGMLSHGAVVSREFGLPAVMGIPNACTKIKTGDNLLLDGYKGTVTIVEK